MNLSMRIEFQLKKEFKNEKVDYFLPSQVFVLNSRSLKMHYIGFKLPYQKMDLERFFLFLVSSVALTLLPGPDLLFVFSTSLTKGWRRGIQVSLGLTSGLWIHTLFVIFGVGNLLAVYPQSQRILECLGGTYLLFLAIKLGLTKSRNELLEPSIETAVKKEHLYFTGLVMNLTNPKVSLFFISFFPGFLFHESWSYGFQFFVLGSLFFIQALLLFSMVSVLADQLGKKLILQQRTIFWNRFQAVILALIALVLFYP